MVWGIVFVAVGVLGLLGATVYWRRVSSWLEDAEVTTAEVLRLEGGMPGQGSVPPNTNPRATVFPVVRFPDSTGRTHEHRARMGAAYRALRGKSSIEVVYDPSNPEDVRLGKGADRGFAITLALLSIACVGMGVYRLLSSG